MSRFFRGGSDSDSDSDSGSGSDEDFVAQPKGTAPQTKRSLFLRTDDTDSEAESDNADFSADESDSDADDVPKKKSALALFGKAAHSDDESDEEDVKKVVKSARDKRFEEMRAFTKQIKNAKKINNWVAIQTEFDKLVAAYTKFTQNKNEPHQRFYIRTSVEVEALVKSVSDNKDAQKKMNATQAKAFNAMKQKIKKHNKLISAEIEKYLLKPVTEEESEDEATEVVVVQQVTPKKVDLDEVEDEEQQEEEGEDASFTIVGKRGKTIDLSPENLYKTLAELLESRGKKSTDKLALIDTLRKLLVHATQNDFQKLRVLLALIPAEFDYTPSQGYMAVESWKHTVNDVNLALSILESHPNFVIRDFVADDETTEQEHEKNALLGEIVYFHGNLASFVDRLDDEFTKALQHLDPHATEYIDRLKDETLMYGLIVRTQKYYEKTHGMDNELISPILMKRVEHIYYKPDPVIKTVEDYIRRLIPTMEAITSIDTLVNDLCLRLYESQHDRIRTRTLLCHAYYHALHDRFHEARDMLLMSHLQETIHMTDISTQVLFNRTMVQIGLCAFRNGMIKEAHTALQEISASGKVKELLAQGVQRYADRTPEQEKLEKQRQLPFHMHVNLELLECVYLVCSMLLEVPNMAVNAHDNRRKVVSKPFRRMLDYHDRQVFVGPPENTRDHVMAAAKALMVGEWKRCRELIQGIKIWELVPKSEKIKEMLGRKIQEEGLRTYFFTYARFYDSLGIPQLAGMFEVSVETVYSITAKMIINEELNAALDQVTQTVVIYRPEETRLEYLAGVYAEKVQQLVESNEKLLEMRSVGLGLQQQDVEKVVKERKSRRGGRR